VALTVLEKNIFKDCAFFTSCSKIQTIFGITEPREQILKRPHQGTFLEKISFLGVIVSEKMFKKKLMLDANTNKMT
jgi:hypothetical protein